MFMFLFGGSFHCLKFANIRYTVAPLILHFSKSSTMDKLHGFLTLKKNADLNKGVVI